MNRIKMLRLELGMTQQELADALGVVKSTVAMYEAETRKPSLDVLKSMSFLFHKSIDYIMATDVEPIKMMQNVAEIYVYGSIPAGIPIEMIEDIRGTEEIPSKWLNGDKKFFGLCVKGDSMYPEYRDNDIIILEKCDDCESGDDCVVMINGNEGTLKRVIKNTNGIVLQPLNTAYQPMIYNNEEIENLPIKIIGKVVELRRKK